MASYQAPLWSQRLRLDLLPHLYLQLLPVRRPQRLAQLPCLQQVRSDIKGATPRGPMLEPWLILLP